MNLPPLGSGRLAARAFAVPRSPRRFRRPTDAVLLVVGLVLLSVSIAVADERAGRFETALATLLVDLPAVLRPVWQVSFDLLQVWVIVLCLLPVVRRRWGLIADLAAGLALVTVGALAAGHLAIGDWPDLLDGLGSADGPVDFPALALTAGAAAVAVANPYLSIPLRHAGRWAVGLGWIAAVALGVTTPSSGLGALALGWVAASLVHLAAGSPGGAPTLRQAREILVSIGIDAEPHTVDVERGVAQVGATAPDGTELDIRVHGRDSWDSQLFVKLWRLVWFRSAGANLAVSRRQQVEHEAFMTLLAERSGTPVAPVVAAMVDARGDALLVAERPGPGLGDRPGDADGAVLSSCWHTLRLLHDAGIRHGAVMPERLRMTGGTVHLSNFDHSINASDDASKRLDQAQMLASTAVVAGVDRATAAALEALGADDLSALTTYVQPAALPPSLRRQAEVADLDIDVLRAAAITAVGGEEPKLQELHRFSFGNVVTSALLFIVAMTMIGAIQEVGIESIVDAIQAASLPVLLLALVIGQTPRFANAASLSAASPIPIPFGRLSVLQFAITFVNLAVPSTAARIAVNIRFFQRSGLDRTSAITIGALDSVAGFVAQIGLIVTILLFGWGSLDLGIGDNLSFDANGDLLIVLLIVLVIGIAVVALVPRFRNMVTSAVGSTWSTVWPLLDSPRRVLRVLAANVLVELLFSLAGYTVLRAFGQEISFAEVVLVNESVALFAGLMPVPGGIGVTEAALTAGYVAIGVDSATAMAAALVYRLITFYIPPLFGYFALKSLRRQNLL